MKERVNYLITKMIQGKKMISTSKYEAEWYFDFKARRDNIMYNFFYKIIYLDFLKIGKELLMGGCTEEL